MSTRNVKTDLAYYIVIKAQFSHNFTLNTRDKKDREEERERVKLIILWTAN